ncbi:unnamed protein product [Didymodactylos carnosus]|uniref:RIIa domain-containing protein n=1 Tax=Didymodactylos carnosus TaxID=1234261 RepID=A0A813P1C4_9BILA|nr:unnamed protein product [Didymodactylos carnosus]CAF0767715.1 unnamed protein product [Didymodactylos carnosus]CAF3524667.1 unnamed protein product [Didymodactylos carnosus]CAF3548219.1 unnamed protein product [Didymodactylos carnosus]
MDARPIENAPYGSEKYDVGALTQEQQKKLNEMKIRRRIENERYMQQHPELQFMIRDFIRQACLQRPENVREFASSYFTHPLLEKRIKTLTEEGVEEANGDMKLITDQIFQK